MGTQGGGEVCFSEDIAAGAWRKQLSSIWCKIKKVFMALFLFKHWENFSLFAALLCSAIDNTIKRVSKKVYVWQEYNFAEAQ